MRRGANSSPCAGSRPVASTVEPDTEATAADDVDDDDDVATEFLEEVTERGVACQQPKSSHKLAALTGLSAAISRHPGVICTTNHRPRVHLLLLPFFLQQTLELLLCRKSKQEEKETVSVANASPSRNLSYYSLDTNAGKSSS